MATKRSTKRARSRKKRPRRWRLIFNPGEVRDRHVVVVNRQDHYFFAAEAGVRFPGVVRMTYKPKQYPGVVFLLSFEDGGRLLIVDPRTHPDKIPDNENIEYFRPMPRLTLLGRNVASNVELIRYRARRPEPTTQKSVVDALKARNGHATLKDLEPYAHRDEVFFLIWQGALACNIIFPLVDDSPVSLPQSGPPRDGPQTIFRLYQELEDPPFPRLVLEEGDLIYRDGQRYRVSWQDEACTRVMTRSGATETWRNEDLARDYASGRASWEDKLLADLESVDSSARQGASGAQKSAVDRKLARHMRACFSALPERARHVALWRRMNLDFVYRVLDDRELASAVAENRAERQPNWLSMRPELGFTLCGLLAHAHARKLRELGELRFPIPEEPESGSNIKRWLSRFETSGGRLTALAPMAAERFPRLNEEVLKIIKRLIKQKYRKGNGCSMDDLQNLVIGAIQEANRGQGDPLEIPSRRTLERIINEKWSSAETDAIRRNVPARNRLLKKWDLDRLRPLEVVEIDDTRFDLMVLNPPTNYDDEEEDIEAVQDEKAKKKSTEKKQKRAARPTFTVVIDVRTKVILSWLLTWEKPCAEIARRAIMLAIQGDPYMAKRCQAKEPSPFGGKPKLIVADNARGFEAADFQDPCDELRIDLQYTATYSGEQKPHVERLIKTINEGFCKGTPGYTPSAVKDRAKGGDPEAEAIWDIEETRKQLGRYILDVYHTRAHSSLENESPLTCWTRLTADHPPARPQSAHAALVFGSVERDQPIGKHGVAFENLHYASSELHRLNSRDNNVGLYDIRVNPHDLTFIGLVDHVDHVFLRLECEEREQIEGLTLEEWKLKDVLRRERRRTVNFSQSAVDATRARHDAIDVGVAARDHSPKPGPETKFEPQGARTQAADRSCADDEEDIPSFMQARERSDWSFLGDAE